MQITEWTADVSLHNIHYRPSLGARETANLSDNFLFILPLAHGRLRLERDGVVLHDGAVQPGAVRIVRPGERATLTAKTSFESVLLAIADSHLQRAASAYGVRLDLSSDPRLRPVMSARYDVQRLVPLLRTASELTGPQRSMLISGLTMALLALVLDADHSPGSERGRGFEQGEFDTILAFAASRLAEHLDLTEWADVVQLSANEFARRFQQHTGVAPYTWFMDRRIDEAKRLMIESGAPLVEVALDSGFCSQSHFTEAFRRRVGTSPGRWRAAQSGTASWPSQASSRTQRKD